MIFYSKLQNFSLFISQNRYFHNIFEGNKNNKKIFLITMKLLIKYLKYVS